MERLSTRRVGDPRWSPAAALLALLWAGTEAVAQPSPEADSGGEPSGSASAPVTAAEATDDDVGPAVRSAHLPDDETLERRGAVIGEIRIRTGDIFDLHNPLEDRVLFRLANRLHRTTRPRVVEQQLLIAPGEPYSRRLLDESERLLRSRRYLYDARIVPVRYHGNRVDLEVVTRDVWTLTGAASVGREGGENSWRFEIQDTSFLGTGKDLTLQQETTVDRTSSMIRYRDPNLRGTRAQLALEYRDNSDGRLQAMVLERPFYALDAHWAAGLRAFADERIDSHYQGGEISDRIHHRTRFCELAGGLSRGLVDGRVNRWRTGITYERHEFAVVPGYPGPCARPEDRLLVYPWVELDSQPDSFLEGTDLDQIRRIEDRQLGMRFRARLGFSSPLWGGDRSRLVFATHLTDTRTPRPGHLMELTLEAAGRWGSSGTEDLLASVRTRYYWRNFGRHLFFASLSAHYADHLDGERQLLLGGDSGLRGYPLRYQDGDRRFLLTLEQRFYTDWHLFQLFHVGGAIFFDVGRAWFAGNGIGSEVLKDVGFGLRIGQSRSGRGTLTHVDVAFPLDGDDSIRRVQFLIRTRDTF